MASAIVRETRKPERHRALGTEPRQYLDPVEACVHGRVRALQFTSASASYLDAVRRSLLARQPGVVGLSRCLDLDTTRPTSSNRPPRTKGETAWRSPATHSQQR